MLSSIRLWLIAARPKTLSVSLVPVLVGTGMAFSEGFSINFFLLLMMFLSSLCIQIGTNLVNDAIDFKKGADREGRLGPLRVTQSGLLPFQKVMQMGIFSFILAFLFGIPLMISGGWIFTLIILLSIACGYLYTGGPYPLAYLGISDLFILVFFGWVSTLSAYYLQTDQIHSFVFLAATQIGLLAIVPQAINCLRDRVEDAKVGKKSFAVRFGSTASRWEITFLSLFPFVLGICWAVSSRPLAAFLPLVALFPILLNLKNIWQVPVGEIYNLYLARSAKYQLLFACLLTLAFVWEK